MWLTELAIMKQNVLSLENINQEQKKEQLNLCKQYNQLRKEKEIQDAGKFDILHFRSAVKCM